MLTVFRIALESLNRLMPKDGRDHKTAYIGFYRQHAEKLLDVVDDVGQSLINRNDTPLILVINCSESYSNGCLIFDGERVFSAEFTNSQQNLAMSLVSRRSNLPTFQKVYNSIAQKYCGSCT